MLAPTTTPTTETNAPAPPLAALHPSPGRTGQASEAPIPDVETPGHRGRGAEAESSPDSDPPPSPSPWDAVVGLAADLLDDIERARISAENQVRSVFEAKGLDPVINAQHLAPLEGLVQGLREVEAQAVRRLESAMKHHPLGPWIQATQGLGLKTAARFLGAVGPLEGRTMPSQLWAYCGLHVVDGKAPRRKRGERANWSTRAKARAYLMAEACVKLNGAGGRRRSPYRDVYDASRALDEERQAERSTPLTDGHMHARAMRKVSKAILADMWGQVRRVAAADAAEERAA